MRPDGRAGCDRDPDARLLRLAARQHGVVTRGQVIASGLTKSMIETRVRRGRLDRIHPGVFCVGGAPRTFEQRSFAAVAWAGPSAALSHASAAHLWQMVDRPPRSSHVWTSHRRTRPPASVCPHFTNDLPRRDRGTFRNIPVTSPARTLIDLAAVVAEAEVERALHRAIVDRRVAAGAVWARLRDAPKQGARGPAVLRRLLTASQSRVASPLERMVAQVLAGHGLPPYRREHPVYVDQGVYYLDFAWPHFRVGVEADGRRWHSDAPSFERDRERHNALTAAGWRVLRVTERQVRNDPGAVRGRVQELVVRG